MDRVLILLGVGLIIAGLAWRLGLLEWFGRLPGDIRIEGERGGFYFPITSMLLISVLLSLLLGLWRR